MTIVDKQHAAEVVNTKGKAFKFDAIECMLPYVQEQGKDQFALFLVNDYLNPGELVPAQDCQYLISKAIPSPMGAFLFAIHDPDQAALLADQHGGTLYSWQGIQAHLNQ